MTLAALLRSFWCFFSPLLKTEILKMGRDPTFEIAPLFPGYFFSVPHLDPGKMIPLPCRILLTDLLRNKSNKQYEKVVT